MQTHNSVIMLYCTAKSANYNIIYPVDALVWFTYFYCKWQGCYITVIYLVAYNKWDMEIRVLRSGFSFHYNSLNKEEDPVTTKGAFSMTEVDPQAKGLVSILV